VPSLLNPTAERPHEIGRPCCWDRTVNT